MPSYLKVEETALVPKVLIIAAAAVNAKNVLLFQNNTFITSGNDGKHMEGSKHYTGEALDFRTKDMLPFQVAAWAQEIRRRLGPNYQVIVESDHLHIEYEGPPHAIQGPPKHQG